MREMGRETGRKRKEGREGGREERGNGKGGRCGICTEAAVVCEWSDPTDNFE